MSSHFDHGCGNRTLAVLVVTTGLLASACGSDGGAPAQGPVEVKAIAVKTGVTQLYADKVAEVRGSQEVDLRARVSGVLLKQEFIDGSLVKENQPLFTIDAREYRAQLANAQAQLASAQANLAHAQQDVARYEPLVAENAISRQVYDAAVAGEKQARAQVEATRAQIQESQLSVDFATVRAPFSGRIGEAKVFEGTLISAGVTPLASVYKDDPAWVYFNVSETELLNYRKRFGAELPAADAPVRKVELRLSDGTVYPEPGHINFVATALDPTTGSYALRAEFPNTQHVLTPGLFGRIRINAERRQDAIVVPDRAVQQQLGRYFVTVVGAGEKAEMRTVTPGDRLGTQWIINEGLKSGDRVVVEGIQKARPGAPLKVALVTGDASETPLPQGR